MMIFVNPRRLIASFFVALLHKCSSSQHFIIKHCAHLCSYLSKLLCSRAMVLHGGNGGKQGTRKAAPKKTAIAMKAMKAAPKASPKVKAAPKAKSASAAQAAQKKLAQDLRRTKEKAARPGASQEDKDKGKAAEEAEEKYKSLGAGEKAGFAVELAAYGIQPGKMKWMASYGKESVRGEHNSDDIQHGYMTRYLYSKHSGV